MYHLISQIDHLVTFECAKNDAYSSSEHLENLGPFEKGACLRSKTVPDIKKKSENEIESIMFL